ncbi:vanadium-dependent haloperoxidase [Halomicroarcula sp. F28]|uniref:vanadium-dependent haloperoxidase n=1 Tax=Haloarcula salinisoli TaxID=2487746 RepID=UPI001C72AB9E|nr:vanadium-dependent haloperoxidase [Halomicroarcula salinisoli]MBX0287679.1 vanadium-dependent haloperoxidase [Halomicroarcula salinisoli]
MVRNDRGSDDSKIDRRRYLQGLALTGGIAATGAGFMSSNAAAGQTEDSSGPKSIGLDGRVAAAGEARREGISDLIDGLEPYEHEYNRDREFEVDVDGTAVRPMVYSKGLPLLETDNGDLHPTGVVPSSVVTNDLIDPLQNNGTLDASLSGTERDHISPPSAHTFPTEGMDSWLGTMPPAPAYDSPRTAGELMDLMFMDMIKHLPFKNYTQRPQTQADDFQPVIDELGEDWWYDMEANQGYMFAEGGMSAREHGPYVSQFLMQDVMYGSTPFTPLCIDREVTGVTRNNTQSEWLDLVAGKGEGAEPRPHPPAMEMQDEPTKFIANGNDLATFVRVDPSYQSYITAALFLLDQVDLDPGLAYTERDDPVHPYIDNGAVGLLDLTARVARNALLAAFHQKWRVHLRLRPETYFGRLHHQFNGDVDFGIPSLLTDSQVVQLTAERRDGDLFLPTGYPEGAPMHPAYPSGHSTIAGACGTVLKTFFENEDWEFDFYRATDADGEERETVSYVEGHNGVHQEIDKLMSNIGIGRLFAGVHYYSDHYWGIKLGEQIAVATLLDHFDNFDTDSSTPTPTFSEYFDYSEEKPVTVDTLEELRANATSR